MSKSSSTPAVRVAVIGLVSSLALLGLDAAAAGAAPTAETPSGNVIVLLRDQHTNLTIARGTRSARMQANRSSQQPVLSRARSAGAQRLQSFTAVNGFAARVTRAQAATLAADPAVAAVVPDLAIRRGPALHEETATATTSGSVKPRTGTCPADPAKPLLEPEALQLTHTAYADASRAQAQKLVDGSGVKVAFIADGLDINNPDFIRADGSHVFVDYQDFSGDGLAAPTNGAEAFGDASSIAAQGRQTYDLASFVNPAHPLPAGCTIQVRGMAPGASLIGLKVFGNAPTAPASRFIEAIDYAVAHGADVLNESFGGNPFPDTSDDPITLADNAALAAGVTVVSSTGDAGTTGTIGSPASSPSGIIGVAGTTSFRSYVQTGGAGAPQFSNGSWISNNISGLSSGGITESGGVPDLAAPGDLGWALCTPDLELYEGCADDAGRPASIQDFGGTSQSSPLVAGAVALVIQAYEGAHGGTRPTPALVKRLLTSTATDLGHPAYEQGSGLLNSLGAVKAAQGWRDGNGAPARTGRGLVVNKTQLRLSGRPGRSVAATVAVTNTGKSVQLVKGSTRSFEDVVSTASGTAPLNTATAPAYIDAFGIARSYVSRTFTVGKVDRLDVSEAAPSAPAASRIILIDPAGTYTAYSIPQGAANYAHIDVRKPKPGTWTAYFALSKSSGFNGTFVYSVVQTDTSRHGTVSPRYRVLRPGQTGRFTVHAKLPTSPEDLSASVQFKGSAGTTTSVPMTLRSVVPPHNATFVGTLTGGNGRSTLPGQANFYRIDVPAGKRDLSLGVRFSDANPLVLGVLTAPDGQSYSLEANSADPTALQLYLRRPMRGRWTFSLVLANPVTGRETSQPFVAQVAYNTVAVRAALPNSRRARLAAGVPVTVPVRIQNTGVAPITYYADARLPTVGTLPLLELSGHETFPLPEPAGIAPFWLVPTHTGQLRVDAVADQPVNLDVNWQIGDPEVYGAANGNAASVQIAADQVAPGIWSANVGQSGPFNGPAPAGTVTLSATARGRLFDPAVTSDGGDPWQLGVGTESAATVPAAVAHRVGAQRYTMARTAKQSTPVAAAATSVSDTPLTLRPGQSGTMLVTITPTGSPGTVVRGDLFVDSFDFDLVSGDELASLPYTYTIG